MNKLLIIALVLLILFALLACTISSATVTESDLTREAEPEPTAIKRKPTEKQIYLSECQLYGRNCKP